MEITFHNWDGSVQARQTAAGMGRDRVQVWLATLPAEETVPAEFARLLSPAEQNRAARYVVPASRREFVFGRACLRLLLGAVLHLAPETLALDYESKGKPRLGAATSSDLHFNLAHSGGIVAAAVARGRAVGVDVECMNPRLDWPLLAEKVFSARERAALFSLPPELQRAEFFQGWTCKEAWLKATGAGLDDQLQTIEVSLTPGNPPEFLALPGGLPALREWGIAAIPLPGNIAGAVVWEMGETLVKPRV